MQMKVRISSGSHLYVYLCCMKIKPEVNRQCARSAFTDDTGDVDFVFVVFRGSGFVQNTRVITGRQSNMSFGGALLRFTSK